MDFAAFKASIHAPNPPDGLTEAMLALWWDARGDWQQAHAHAQADPGQQGAAVHAYLHRKEPDIPNARYWYSRAGRSPFQGGLEAEWEALAQELLANP